MKEFSEIYAKIDKIKNLLQNFSTEIATALVDDTVQWVDIKSTILNLLQEFYDREADMQKELELASRIQEGSLPPIQDNWEGIRYSAYLSPMAQVSGDFYDVIKAKNFYKIIIADASGHGIPAALVTMAAKEAFHSPQIANLTPKEFLKAVNDEICKRITTQDYLTGFILHFLNSQEFLYSSAGHHPAYVIHKDDGFVQAIDSEGTFIGAMPEAGEYYSEIKGNLLPGDKLVLYTDGLLEQINEQDEIYGVERLYKILQNSNECDGEQLLKRIVSSFDSFRAAKEQTDDVTVIVVELQEEFFEVQELIADGKRCLKNKNFSKALEYALQAQEKISYLPEINYLIAVSLYHMQRYSESISFFELFFKKIQFRMRTVGLMYFDALRKSGQEEKALSFGKQVLNEKMPQVFYKEMLNLAQKLQKFGLERLVSSKIHK